MYVKVFVNIKVFAIHNQESEPWEPIGKAQLSFSTAMMEPLKLMSEP